MKTRLNKTTRAALLDLAIAKVTPGIDARYDVEIAAEDKALQALAHKIAEDLWKPADMAVLAKYDAHCDSKKLRFATDERHNTRTVKLDNPIRTPAFHRHYHGDVIKFGTPECDTLTTAWVRHHNLVESKAKALQEALAPYEVLIRECRYYEDVIEVWAEAVEAADKICGGVTALAKVTPEVVEAIKTDVASRRGGR